MTAQELIMIQPSEIRRNANLMAVYLNYYYSYFGRNSVCTGCTFDNDFRTFVRAVKNGEPKFTKQIINDNKMENTFKILDPSEIYSYRPAGESVKRCYGSNMNEEFAIAYLTIGTETEIEKRKLEFKVLPAFLTEVVDSQIVETETEPKKRGRKPTEK